MAKNPNDRPDNVTPDDNSENPEIYIIVNSEKFPRPGLETYFADAKDDKQKTDKPGCSCDPVAGVYCSCNKVSKCSCVPVCTCQSVCGSVGKCSCVGHRSCQHSPGGTVVGCRCAPVH